MGKSSRRYSTVTMATLLMVLAGALVAFWTLNAVVSIFALQNLLYLRSNTPSIVKDRLDMALEKAAMANKTVIIAIVNEAYVERFDNEYTTNMFDLFLESFWEGEETRWLINHLLVVAVDDVAYMRCVFRGLHCYKLPTYGVDLSKEGVYMSKDFIKMMWLRTIFLSEVLNKGYNFIFSDVDVMWLRNPVKLLKAHLSDEEQDDIQFSVDYYNGNARSAFNPINTGFYFIRSNKKTISLFKTWYALKDHPSSAGLKEQDILQTLIRHSQILRRLNLTITFLDTRRFSGFCQVGDDPRVIVTLHANCCRYISAKVADLTRVLRDWRRFRSLASLGETRSFWWSGHAKCLASWDDEDSGVGLEPLPSLTPSPTPLPLMPRVDSDAIQSTSRDDSEMKLVFDSYHYLWVKNRRSSSPSTLLFRDKFNEV